MMQGIGTQLLLPAVAGVLGGGAVLFVWSARRARRGNPRLRRDAYTPGLLAPSSDSLATRLGSSDIDREQYLALLARWAWGRFMILGGQQ
jgi:hypothetical protein